MKDEGCIISNTCAYIPVDYNETIRVKKLVLFFKEALYKGLSEKEWDSTEAVDLRQGTGTVLLDGLERGTMYKLYAVAYNDFGSSTSSNELWFRTFDSNLETRILSK